jgi:hypothetical protein
VPASAVEQTLAVYVDAVEAVDLTKRAALQASRSWVGGAKQALPRPAFQPDPWALIDLGFDAADLYVTAQTWYARTLLDGVAETMEAFFSGDTDPNPPPSAVPVTLAPPATAVAPDTRTRQTAAAQATPAATPKAGGSEKRPAPRKRPTA